MKILHATVVPIDDTDGVDLPNTGVYTGGTFQPGHAVLVVEDTPANRAALEAAAGPSGASGAGNAQDQKIPSHREQRS